MKSSNTLDKRARICQNKLAEALWVKAVQERSSPEKALERVC